MLAFAAIAASSASAFANSFDANFFGTATSQPAAEDDSFFVGHALTMGKMSAINPYLSSATSYAYSDSVDGETASTETVVYSSVSPVRIYQPCQPVRNALRFSCATLRCVRNFLVGNYDYCRPAYVCDPCWNVCDPCEPSANCAVDVCANDCAPACAPCGAAVFAPRGCCGYGTYPGVVNPVDPTTGKSAVATGGVDRVLNVPEISNTNEDQAPQGLDPQVVVPAAEQPDVLDAQPTNDVLDVQPMNDSLIDGYDSEIESIPTPAPSTGAGVLRMLVPEDSIVYVNGYRTKQKGAVRTFAARDLQVGETYEFTIRVVAVRNGKTFEDVQKSTLTAGQSTALAFNLTLRDNEAYAYID